MLALTSLLSEGAYGNIPGGLGQYRFYIPAGMLLVIPSLTQTTQDFSINPVIALDHLEC